MPTTPLLAIDELTPNQTGKETTINNAILALEEAGNATLAVSMAGGNVTLSATQTTRNFIFACSGLTANRVLNLPALINGANTSRLFVVANSSAFSVTVQITGGAGANVVVLAGFTFLLYADGAGNIKSAQASNPIVYYRYGGSGVSLITTDEVLMDHIVSEPHTLAANFAGSFASVGTNPAASWVATVKKNGSTIGTITISTGGVATLATSGGTSVSVAAGDVISLHAPTAVDGTIARVRWTFEGVV